MLKQLIALSRPKQWAKQVFLLLPVISAVNEISIDSLGSLLISFAAFSLLAISVYTNNDIYDAPFDQKDTSKKNRPIASGKVTTAQARVFQSICLLLGFSFFFLVPNTILCVVASLSYVLVNFFYSKFKLKNQGTLGILIVASGFPIRFLVGSWTLDIEISYWALVLILQLSLFLLAGKRFQGVKRNSHESKSHDSLDSEVFFWQTTLVVLACLLLTTYSGFISQTVVQLRWGNSTLLLSSIFIAMGIIRYLEIVIKSEKYKTEDSTETILKDCLIAVYAVFYITLMIIGRHLNG